MAAVTAAAIAALIPTAAQAVEVQTAPVMVQQNEGVGDEPSDSELGHGSGSILSDDGAGVAEGPELAISSDEQPEPTIVERAEHILFPMGLTDTTRTNLILSVGAILLAGILVFIMFELPTRVRNRPRRSGAR